MPNHRFNNQMFNEQIVINKLINHLKKYGSFAIEPVVGFPSGHA
jgi:hypothetical protein